MLAMFNLSKDELFVVCFVAFVAFCGLWLAVGAIADAIRLTIVGYAKAKYGGKRKPWSEARAAEYVLDRYPRWRLGDHEGEHSGTNDLVYIWDDDSMVVEGALNREAAGLIVKRHNELLDEMIEYVKNNPPE